jgi:hypothetical protein
MGVVVGLDIDVEDTKTVPDSTRPSAVTALLIPSLFRARLAAAAGNRIHKGRQNNRKFMNWNINVGMGPRRINPGHERLFNVDSSWSYLLGR